MSEAQDKILAGSFIQPGGGCWIWSRGRTTAGYGLVTVGKKKQAYAHRVSWEAWRGRIPVGLQVLHHCDTPYCVNPEHLFLGSRSDNMRDMVSKGRNGSRVKPHRVARGERAGPAKLTEDDARAILRRRRDGVPASALARAFGVTPAAVRMLVRGRTWGHLSREVA